MLKAKGTTAKQQKALVAALKTDYRSADLNSVDRSMLDYAVKLTHTPDKISAKDIEVLRKEGFDDRSIHDICCITAYYAFVNRIADGLGVEMESQKKS